MEKNQARYLIIVRSVSGNGTAFRPPAQAPRLPTPLSPEWREELHRRRPRPWPPRWVQVLIVAVLGTLLGIGMPMLMGWLGY